jgi:hypothetical protein
MFKDIDENTIEIEIYKNFEDAATTVAPSELQCSADAVFINYESDDDIFKPIKCSDCQINIVTNKILTDLYTALKNEIYCLIKKNGKTIWCGFSVPCLYQSDYDNEYNQLSLQFNDILSSLENYKYTYVNDSQSIASFYSILKHIINKIDSQNLIKNIYVHNSKRINGTTELLNNLFILDRNFFDESEEAENCKDIIEYISRFLGTTCYYFEDSIYFTDFNSIKSIKEYTKYNLSDDTNEVVTINGGLIDVNSNVYYANATISINEQYNKVVVIANTNSNNTIIPDWDDADDLINQNADPNKFYETHRTIDNKDYTMLNAFFKSKSNWNWQQPNIMGVTLEEITVQNADSNGSYWQKAASYETENEPSSLNWKTYFTMADYGLMGLKTTDGIQLSLKNKPPLAVKGGTFIIDIKYRLSGDWNAADCVKTSDEQYYDGKYSTGFVDTMFKCRLAVGDKMYYDGDGWVNYQEYIDKTNRGYYQVCSGPNTWQGAQWYKFLDEYGYWRFCNETEYNASTREKYTGGYDDVNAVYMFMRNGERIFVEKWYFDECKLQDCFYLVHKNKTGDKVFDTEYSLTNTVSWRMNLADSEDGVAIHLPENQITLGELIFELYPANQLGTTPMRRTDQEAIRCNAFHLSDIKLKYTTSSYVKGIFDDEVYDDDIKFENVINEEIVKELDDIEFRVNTFNEHSGSYSYVLFKQGDSYKFVENIFDISSKETKKSEEHCIEKYTNYYSKPRFIYSNSIKDKNVNLNSILNEKTTKKDYIINSITYDLINNKVDVELNEIN